LRAYKHEDDQSKSVNLWSGFQGLNVNRVPDEEGRSEADTSSMSDVAAESLPSSASDSMGEETARAIKIIIL
jgi:hypothetical protein